jgi:hypothetical protein
MVHRTDFAVSVGCSTNDREWPRSDAHQVAVKTRTRGLRNSQTGPSGHKTKRADTLSNQQAMPETGKSGRSAK